MMSLKMINVTVWLLSHHLNYLFCPSGKIYDRNIRGKGLIFGSWYKGVQSIMVERQGGWAHWSGFARSCGIVPSRLRGSGSRGLRLEVCQAIALKS